MKQLSKAVDVYMSEYINNSDVRKKADEERKKEKIRRLTQAMQEK